MNDIIYPIAVHQNEQISELEPKQQREFPDPVRFPPPLGEEGRCGCLMTRWPDARDGGFIRLETLWQPYWDTQEVKSGDPSVSFFQKPNGRPQGWSNLPTAGALTWPKRFHLWELVFQVTGGLESFVRDLDKVCPAMVMLQIGEKWHFASPLTAFYRPRPGIFRAALCIPLYIPSVQHFSITIYFEKNLHDFINGQVRCIMNGYLHREIP